MTNALPFLKQEVEQSIVARWRRVARRFPERVAVTTPDGGQVTYQTIDAQSDQIAWALVNRLGLENAPVILFLEHTPLLIATIIGVLKANKAYIALGPMQTTELGSLLKTPAAPRLIITTAEHHSMARTVAESQQDILHLEDVGETGTLSDIEISPDALAALFFTSGTGGQSKGVPYSQRMILHRIWVETNTYQLTAEDRFSGLRACGVAASIRDIFNALLNGGALCLYPLQQYGLGHLSTWLLNQGITYFHLPGTLYRAWLETLPAGASFPALRYLSPSGRKTIRDCERIWSHLDANACLISTYATTETSLLSQQLITRQTPLREDILPVGQPVPDKQITLVDEHAQPVAAGQVGEVIVRSRYIASEYWQQPELSAQRFAMPDHGNGEIIYRTGDFGRLRSDGGLELLGRQDSQVKVRGYRVILDDVETLLARVNGVAQTAVKVFPTPGGDNRLVGYVTELPGAQLSVSAIRHELSAQVAAHLVPAQIVILPELPLTRTGKIDRQALPAPGAARPSLDTPFRAPRNELEQQLAELWATALDVDQVGIDDDFYELGGDSLVAVRLLLRVEQHFGVNIPAAFFAQPTVAHLAAWIAGEDSAAPVVPGPNARTRQKEDRPWQRGPAMRGLALPYRIGVWLQPRWLRLPPVQRRLWRESAIFREWHAWLGIDDPDGRRLHQSLLANTWGLWRNRQLQRANVFARWVDVSGSEWLALAADRPLVLMTAHTTLTRRLAQALLLQKSARPFTWLGRNRGDPIAGIENYARAQSTLRQGGIVMVASDGVVGRTGVALPFLGHRWRFRSGAAELAQEAEAVVLPVFTTLEAGGRVKVSFQPPLHLPDARDPDWIGVVMGQYAQVLAALWQENLSTIPWHKLRQIGASPRLDSGVSPS
jgi:acyl-coenzyme A synthetase/AMP-(fatty) acid ligase/acyl carrier protein